MEYFSERETGPIPQTSIEISTSAWLGIVALIEIRVDNGSFGEIYPAFCPMGNVCCGTDRLKFLNALKAEIPNLSQFWNVLENEEPPPIADLMDMIEFCWAAVGKPKKIDYHEDFFHDHLEFDSEEGKIDFCDAVNRIFRRNGLAYELSDSGEIQKLSPPGFHEVLTNTTFSTGDSELDRLLETAREKFLDPDLDVRRESLESLWDAWERIKTIEPRNEIEETITLLLNIAAESGDSKFRELLESEAKELTCIENSFRIRHGETSQESIQNSDHVDYLFLRLFSMINLLLRTTGLGG